ncbi:MAG: hypothetical protein V4508_25200 [Pseudomonadota bacterium]
MSTILAGHVQLQDDAKSVRDALLRVGFRDDQISTFFVNQPGQHDMTPYGGDYMESPGAKQAPVGIGEGIAVGGAVGAAVGAVSSIVAGPIGPVVGALVGAHVGSLYSFSKMKEAGDQEADGSNQKRPRLSGMLVAVALPVKSDQPRAMDVFSRLGVHHLELAEGTILGGDWVDFNPLSLPVLLA